jgi:hypothetical protein
MYVRDYLSNYPGLQEKDYPKFEDFDHDGTWRDVKCRCPRYYCN